MRRTKIYATAKESEYIGIIANSIRDVNMERVQVNYVIISSKAFYSIMTLRDYIHLGMLQIQPHGQATICGVKILSTPDLPDNEFLII